MKNTARMERAHDMIILRGLPGSGKSRRARQILAEYGGDGEIFSADDYFRSLGGRITIDLLHRAHTWNRQRVQNAVDEGIDPIIIDNTNLGKWEMWPYARMAYFNDYYVTFEHIPGCHLDEHHRRCQAQKSAIKFEDLQRMFKAYEPVRNFFDVLYSRGAWRKWKNSNERIQNGW